MKHHYWVHFKSQKYSAGEHTRAIALDHPLEFESDIADLQDMLAKEIDVDRTMVLHWTPLVGLQRHQFSREDQPISPGTNDHLVRVTKAVVDELNQSGLELPTEKLIELIQLVLKKVEQT